MSAALREFLSAVAAAIAAEDGLTLARLLSQSPQAASPLALAGAGGALSDRARSDAVGAYFSPAHDATRVWHGVLVSLLAASGAACARGDAEAAFAGSHAALDGFLDAVLASSTNWLVPALHALVRDTLAALRRLEGALRARGRLEGAPEQLNSLVTTLRNAFSCTLNHRLPREQLALSKKWGALAIANAVFGIFFAADQLRGCKSIQAGVESPVFPELARFPRAQVVTYRYYTGVLAACEDKFGRARALLSDAARECHVGYAANRRRILRMLVPVTLLATGRTPPPALLAAHGLAPVYGALVRAFRAGDIGAYNDCLERHRDAYIRMGVYLVVERLQLLVYRTMFRKICTQLVALTGSVKIKLSLIHAGAVAAGCAADVDLEEVECLLATLIFRKLIRGYLSQSSRVLVLAKAHAFRPLPELLAATADGDT